jgi:hypothetical protein
MHAQDFLQRDPGAGDERVTGLFRLAGEAGVVRGQIDLAQPCVRGRHGHDAGAAQLRRQTLLQRSEYPFHPSAPLRRVGRDVPDPELLQRAPHLGRLFRVHLAAGFRREEVVRAAVGVQ